MPERLENRPSLAPSNASSHYQELFKDAYPSPAPESWTATLANFENAARSYETSKNATHPFTAGEIAQAGLIAGVEFNAETQNGTMSILANDAPNRVPSSALEAALNQSDMLIVGLSLGSGGSGCFGSSEQIRADVLENASQSGSAGVDQLGLSDCPFESAVASLASTKEGQGSIAQMITQNKDGSYCVQFPGAKKPVTVSKKDLENPALGNSAVWANVLEAASFKLDPATAESGTRAKGVLNYMSLLTKNVSHCKDLTGSKEVDVEAGLRNLLNHGAVIEGGDAPPGVPLEQGHAYSILGLKGDTLIIRNPWGNHLPEHGAEPKVGEIKQGVTNLGGGELSMSVQTYMEDLPGLFYSEQK